MFHEWRLKRLEYEPMMPLTGPLALGLEQFVRVLVWFFLG